MGGTPKPRFTGETPVPQTGLMGRMPKPRVFRM